MCNREFGGALGCALCTGIDNLLSLGDCHGPRSRVGAAPLDWRFFRCGCRRRGVLEAFRGLTRGRPEIRTPDLLIRSQKGLGWRLHRGRNRSYRSVYIRDVKAPALSSHFAQNHCGLITGANFGSLVPSQDIPRSEI